MTTGLERFRQEAALSFAELANLCGGPAAGANTTAIRTLCLGQATAAQINKLRPLVDAGLKLHWDVRHVSEFNQTRLLKKIWADTMPALKSQIFEPKESTMLPPVILPFECLVKFGLRHDPFEVGLTDEEMFVNPEVDFIFNSALRTIQKAGFCCVLGEPGAGKSVVQRRLADYADNPKNRVRLCKIECEETEAIYPGQIVGAILRAFDQYVPRDRAWRAEKLTQTLTSAAQQRLKVGVVIDDAHRTSGHLLMSLKKFNEQGGIGRNLLSVLLFGQPQFERRFLDPRYTEISQRLTRLHMPKFSKFGSDYLRHRVETAGADLNRIFNPDALALLCENFHTPLALGNAAATAILTAYQRGMDRVTTQMVTIPNEPNVRQRNIAIAGK